MRFTAGFVAAASIYLLPLVSAEADPAEAAGISRPQFTSTEIKAPFLEQFTDDWETRWRASHAKKETKSDEEEWQYIGEWSVEEPEVLKGIDGDKGLVAKNAAAHHAMSSMFNKPIDPKGKDFVVQYEVKLQDGLQCGGAYMKLLQNNKQLKSDEFSNASPYVIMFGPDRCGSTNKVHFIFKHKNPKTGEYEEKHMDDSVSAITDKGLTTLYTLWVKPDQTFQLRVNGKAEKNGTLLEDFDPPVNPPKEIDDPNDKKPDDWVDTAKMADPEARKPDDWDEDAPYQIPDMDAEKPADWLDDEPTMIADPEAEKPADWDDEEDGDWQPPMVPNPKCAEASGCGPWERPNKKNPDYKGMWSPPMIDNPLYKGEWKPRKINNPNYYEDKTPANFEPIGGIGFEIWTMQGNILFDNIYIGHSIEDAEKLQRETFDIKYAVEEKENEASQPKPEPPVIPGEGFDFAALKADPIGYLRTKVELFLDIVKADPITAFKTVPEVSVTLGVVLISLIALLAGGGTAAAKSPEVQDAAKKAKDQATDAKDKAADAVSSGAEKAQNEVNKRTTRSSANSDS